VRVGPGLVTGAANVDPSAVLTATVAGAAYGYSLLWVVILCIPFLLSVFAVSARLGHETRQGFVDLLRTHYGSPVALSCALLVIASNMALIVADLIAVTDALSIILDQRRIFFIAAVAFSVWFLLIFHHYHRITRVLVICALPLFAYVASAVLARPSPRQILLHSFLPHVARDPGYAMTVVGLFGSLLTPYVLIWQSSSRREQASLEGLEPHYAEHPLGTFVTTLIAFSVIVAAAAILNPASIALNPEQVSNMSFRQAALALSPLGQIGPILFALGIIGAGMVALPVLVASLCYATAEAMGWKSGLSENPWEAKRFYVLISAVVFLAAAANFFHINPVQALYWSQVLAGILTIPILIFILVLSNDRRIMRTTNTSSQNFWIGAAAGGLTASGLLLLWWKLASG
jgi:Mn2+/Fe2+ NRAMP family transporter